MDHVQPLYRGGDPWTLENLQTLCRACHISKTRNETMSPERLAWDRLLRNMQENIR